MKWGELFLALLVAFILTMLTYGLLGFIAYKIMSLFL